MGNPFDLTGRNAIVTGAGQGIGRVIANTLAAAGANIAIAELNAENGETVAEEIRSKGCDAISIVTDVTQSSQVDAMTQQAAEHFGHIDILVNNAGVVHHQAAEDVADDDWLRVINVNLNGVYWCCRSVGKHMLERGAGSIVSIASMSGTISNTPQPQASYNASKAAVIHLTKSLAGEWAERGVRVNCVSPGYIGTPMALDAIERVPEWNATWMAMTPMKRLGTPEEVANAVWYLASDASSFCTGTDLIMDGGYTSW